MLTKLQHRLNSEQKGFTLIELLVVILIIGILAAIALPAFLGQRSKGQDSSAKSDARNMVSQVESCYTDTQDYAQCQTAAELPNTGLDIGGATGQVEVTAAATDTYTIVGHSKSNNNFTITKGTNGAITRTCTTANSGSCLTTGTW
jgi:type IV pilus assembly protein PilA